MFKNIADLAQHLEKKGARNATTPPSTVRPASVYDTIPLHNTGGPSSRPLPRSIVHGTVIQSSHNGLSTSGLPLFTTQTGDESIHNLRVVTYNKKVLGRLIIVGDVHGCPDQLRNLVDELRYTREIDTLIIAGDLINKGPDSLGAVKLAMELGAYALLGNHDITVLNFVDKIDSGEISASNRKYAKDQAMIVARSLTEDAVQYLRRLPHVIKIPQFNLIITHAGFNISYRLEDQSVRDVTNIRRLLWNGQEGVYETITSGSDGIQWAQLWQGPETVVFGHDARAGLQQEQYAIGLDTGCCYGGQLTAVTYPGGRLVQVPGLPVSSRPEEDVTPSSPTPALLSEIEAAFPQNPPSSDNDLSMAPAVMELFEKNRLRNNTTSNPNALTPSSSKGFVTPPTVPEPIGRSSSGTSESDMQRFAWDSLELLWKGDHLLAVLALLRDDRYQSAWSAALDGTLSVADSSWSALTCNWAKHLQNCKQIDEDTQAMMDVLLEILNEKKDSVSAAAIFEVQKFIAQLESGSITGASKGAVKALKLSLK